MVRSAESARASDLNRSVEPTQFQDVLDDKGRERGQVMVGGGVHSLGLIDTVIRPRGGSATRLIRSM
jgi:hypothetical protein